MSEIKIAFWNLQNLFDTTISEIAADLGYTPERGWTEAVMEQKISNLAAVINQMHDGDKPDLLGVCEIENKNLAEKLIEAIDRDDYKVAHVESPDIRGIDTSLIYSSDVFELDAEPIGHLVHLRFKTRDIFEVPLRVKENNAKLTILVNHWPSRSRGKFESEPFRLTVANYCGRLGDQLLKLPKAEFLALPNTEASLELINERWNRNILLMGDFNDEPFDRSILAFLQASNGIDHLEEPIKKSSGRKIPSPSSYLRKQSYFFNCMWPKLGIPDEGTYYFSEATNSMNLLDQFMVSKGLYFGEQGLKFNHPSVEIFKPSIMATGSKKRPKKFEYDKKKIKRNGYSDHFPITATIDLV
jgi:predicted extracellular nuclease